MKQLFAFLLSAVLLLSATATQAQFTPAFPLAPEQFLGYDIQYFDSSNSQWTSYSFARATILNGANFATEVIEYEPFDGDGARYRMQYTASNRWDTIYLDVRNQQGGYDNDEMITYTYDQASGRYERVAFFAWTGSAYTERFSLNYTWNASLSQYDTTWVLGNPDPDGPAVPPTDTSAAAIPTYSNGLITELRMYPLVGPGQFSDEGRYWRMTYATNDDLLFTEEGDFSPSGLVPYDRVAFYYNAADTNTNPNNPSSRIETPLESLAAYSPAAGSLRLSNLAAQPLPVQVFDLLGRHHLSTTLQPHEERLLENLNEGLYFIRYAQLGLAPAHRKLYLQR